MVRAFEFLKTLDILPTSLQRGQGKQSYGRPSNQELKRWLENGSVMINGGLPLPTDEVQFPITQLIFFPKSAHKITMVEVEGKIPTPEEAKAVLEAQRCCKANAETCPDGFKCPYDKIIIYARYLPQDDYFGVADA